MEVNRLLLLTRKSVERVSFSLPRADKLRAFFQDDVFGPCPVAPDAPLAASAWLAGANAMPAMRSLQPDGETDRLALVFCCSC